MNECIRRLVQHSVHYLITLSHFSNPPSFQLPPHTFSVSSLQNFVALVSSALSTESLPLAKITQNGLEHSPVPPSFASRRRGSLPFFPHPSSSHLLVPSKSPQITSVLPRELSSASINVSHNSSCIFTFESDVD